MKFCLIAALLAPVALSFTCAVRQMSVPTASASLSKLHYMEKSQEAAVDTDGVVDMGAAVSQVSAGAGALVDEDTVLVQNLAFSLNMDDDFLKAKYEAWAHKYNKQVDSVRFFNWKRNFLMQEVWNRTNGESFDLNEFGDFTKAEFDQMNVPVPDEADADAAHAYFFEEHASVVPETKPVRQGSTPRGTSGGFVGSAFAKLQPPTATVRVPMKQAPAAATAAKRFSKVRLFSGAYKIVPVDQEE